MPGLCNSTFYYALFYPRGLKEILIFLVSILVCFLAIPCGLYFLDTGPEDLVSGGDLLYRRGAFWGSA